MDEAYTDVVDLRHYAAVLRRQRWIVLGTVALVVVVAMAVTAFQTPTYESSAHVVLRPTEALSDANLLDQVFYTESTLQTERQVIDSPEIAERVAGALGLEDPPQELTALIETSIVRDSQVIAITARVPEDPVRAAELAQGFADEYIEYRRERAVTETTAAADALEERVRAVRARAAELSADLRGASPEEAALIEESRAALLSQLAQLETQITGLRTAGTTTGGGSVIQPAQTPTSPVSPKPLRTGVLALVLGAMLGVGLAFLRDSLEDSITSEEDAERAAGAAVVGHVPHWEEAPEHEEGARLAILTAPGSVVAEAYRSVRANVRFVLAAGQQKSVLVSSAGQGDGKTTTASNLAAAFATAGTRVLLVDTDLRRPAVAATFGIDRGHGLSDYLAGDGSLRSIVRDVGVPNLRVVTAGTIPPNPSELLISPRMAETIREFEAIADLVIFDGPPALAVADAVELSSRVGGCFLVVDAKRSRRREVQRAASRFRAVGGDVLGTILNNVDPRGGYYGYYYVPYESEDEPSPARGNGAPAPAGVEGE